VGGRTCVRGMSSEMISSSSETSTRDHTSAMAAPWYSRCEILPPPVSTPSCVNNTFALSFNNKTEPLPTRGGWQGPLISSEPVS
jgi:hypothetical protein